MGDPFGGTVVGAHIRALCGGNPDCPAYAEVCWESHHPDGYVVAYGYTCDNELHAAMMLQILQLGSGDRWRECRIEPKPYNGVTMVDASMDIEVRLKRDVD